MKNKKTCIKLLLDMVMLIVFVLLLHKMNFGLAFHEIAGLSIMVAFLIHLAINWRWIYGVTKNIFNKNTRFSARLSWIINFSLLVCFAIIGISGIFISKVVFHFQIPGNWKIIHYFCTALAIILLGIHVGLHASMIGNAVKRVLHLSQNIAKTLCICLTVAMVGLGVYSMMTESFVRWLSMPFMTQTNMAKGFDSEFVQDDAVFSEKDEKESEWKNNLDQKQIESAKGGDDRDSEGGDQLPNMKGDGKFPEMDGGQKGNFGKSNFVLNAMKGISIVYVFAVVTALFKSIILRKNIQHKNKMV